jgi:hypothetical protein
MSILITAMALAAAPAPAAVQPAAAPATHPHAQATKPGAEPRGEGCSCCKDMAAGGKMECCAKHGEGHDEHSKHDAGH